jgi:hypothetical protein
MQTYVVSDDMEYVVHFTATDNDSYDKYISMVNSIVKSITIDDSKKC